MSAAKLRDGGEKKRLEQALLQMRATGIFMMDPRYLRFQPENIDRIRLLQAQREAGKKPITEKLLKQVKKTRKKGRKTKVLRGETARNIREQRRFERGERRDRPEDEPRIVGEPRNTGLAYDPDIERRRLDIQAQQLADANLRALADRRAQAVAQERELAVRRGELAAARAERALERQRIAAIPPPVAPVINVPAAPAPNIRVEAPQIDLGGVRVEAPPPAQVRVEAPRVDVAPVINVPPAQVADPIPEIQRLGADLRADVDAYGAEQRQRNEGLLAELRRQQVRQAELEARQGVIDEEQRQRILAQDAQYQEVQARLGMNQVEMGRARDAVIQEIRDAEERLRQATGELNRPVNYDDVILRAVDEAVRQGLEEGTPEVLRRRIPIEEVEEGTPTPRPQEPAGIESVIQGGGELNLPNVVVERPGSIEAGPDESLRLSPEESRFFYPRGTGGGAGRRRGGAGPLRATEPEPELEPEPQREIQPSPAAGPPSPATTPSSLDLGIPEERLRRGGGRGTGQFSGSEEEFRLEPAEPIDVADALRLSRLALGEAAPDLALEEADDPDVGPEQARLRLTDTQDFLAGFERQVEEPPTPSPTPRARTPERAVDEQSLQPVAEGIAQFGGASQPAPPRVIEDAGIVAQPARELRPLDPDVLFEPLEEAEEVGEIQDNRPQAIRDSATLYGDALPELAGNIRQGPRGPRQEGESTRLPGLGFRVRNNTDRILKKIQPGDVVNIIGVEAGARGEGRFRLDTETRAGTRVSADEFGPLIEDGSFLFERGHRHELGGHFDREPYGPEPGLLQQGAEAVGGAVGAAAPVVGEGLAAVAGAGARGLAGVAQGVGQGLYEQLPAAGDVGAALGRGAVAGVVGAGRLAAGAAGAVLGGGEEEEEEEEEP